MRFTVNREVLFKPLQLVVGIIEKRHTIPILANILLRIKNNSLFIIGTDNEIEIVAKLQINSVEEPGETTVSAKKILEICRLFSEKNNILFFMQDKHIILKSESSKFMLATISPEKFPCIKQKDSLVEFDMQQSLLRHLIEKTGFAMSQEDIRYYLNGMLFEIKNKKLNVVTTDGHRLALCSLKMDNLPNISSKYIIPRKGVFGLARMITQESELVHISFSERYVTFKTTGFVFTSKLIDGEFPYYERAIPREGDKKILINRETLRQSLLRVSILTNEKYRGIKMFFDNDLLKVMSNDNPEQEKAEEEMEIEYTGKPIEIGVNAYYVLNVLSALSEEKILIIMSNSTNPIIIQDPEYSGSLYVVMPMCF